MAEGRRQVKHIFYADEVTSICSDRVMIPDNPIRFPAYDGDRCLMCEIRMGTWINWWRNQGTDNKKEN